MRTHAWLEVNHPVEADRIADALRDVAPAHVGVQRNDSDLGALGIPRQTHLEISFEGMVAVDEALARCGDLVAAAGVQTRVGPPL